MNDDVDIYGDTDPNNVPDDGAGQNTTAGDGAPGYPIDGHPSWRAGAFGSANGLLGVTKAADADSAAARGGAIDWDFIHGLEAAGGPGLSMSVPPNKQHHALDQSGPTIGYGFDAGQRSVDDLRKLGLSQPIIDALSPYTGMKGDQALAYVKAHPLTLDRSAVDAIDGAVARQIGQTLASKFDAASRIGSFASLPSHTQTAIADLFYQYGAGDPAAAAPNFWRQVTGGDWNGAYNNLQKFHDKYPTRRGKEAGQLKQDIDAGILPGGTKR